LDTTINYNVTELKAYKTLLLMY